MPLATKISTPEINPKGFFRFLPPGDWRASLNVIIFLGS